MKFLTKLLGTYIAYSWGNLWGTTKKVRLTIFRRCVQNCTLSLFPSRQTSSLSGEITYSHYDVKQFACAWLAKTLCHLASRGLIFRALRTANKGGVTGKTGKITKLFFLFKQDTCSSNLIIEKLGENVTENRGNCNGHNVICFGLQQTVCFSLSFIDRRGSTCHRRYQG